MAPNNQGRGREWPFPFANVRKADFTTKFDAIQRVETIAQSSEPLTRENSVEVCTCACVCVIPACRGFRANLCAPVPLTTLGPWRGSVNGNVSSKLACGREKASREALFVREFSIFSLFIYSTGEMKNGNLRFSTRQLTSGR